MSPEHQILAHIDFRCPGLSMLYEWTLDNIVPLGTSEVIKHIKTVFAKPIHLVDSLPLTTRSTDAQTSALAVCREGGGHGGSFFKFDRLVISSLQARTGKNRLHTLPHLALYMQVLIKRGGGMDGGDDVWGEPFSVPFGGFVPKVSCPNGTYAQPATTQLYQHQVKFLSEGVSRDWWVGHFEKTGQVVQYMNLLYKGKVVSLEHFRDRDFSAQEIVRVFTRFRF
jgi:hypothetical protein